MKAVPYDSNIMNASEWSYNYALGYKQLASGLCCGLSSLAAGLAIGVVGDAGVRANGQKNILIALILMMIFAEALALYGFIIAIVLVMSSWMMLKTTKSFKVRFWSSQLEQFTDTDLTIFYLNSSKQKVDLVPYFSLNC